MTKENMVHRKLNLDQLCHALDLTGQSNQVLYLALDSIGLPKKSGAPIMCSMTVYTKPSVPNVINSSWF